MQILRLSYICNLEVEPHQTKLLMVTGIGFGRKERRLKYARCDVFLKPLPYCFFSKNKR